MLPKRFILTLIKGMKPPELFGVFVRLTGLLIVLYGLYELWAGLDNVVENLIDAAQGNNSDLPSSFGFFAFSIPSLIVGSVVFFFADLIARLAYRNREQ
jgi:hypothetical protein